MRCSLRRAEIGLIEKGLRLPRIDTLVKLTGALEVKADDLLQGIEWTQPPSIRSVGSFVVRPAA